MKIRIKYTPLKPYSPFPLVNYLYYDIDKGIHGSNSVSLEISDLCTKILLMLHKRAMDTEGIMQWIISAESSEKM